jgi:alpha-ketoglutarate-dependent taurine dioxygenase
MLNTLVTDKRLAWEKGDVTAADFRAVLSDAARNELVARRGLLRVAPGSFDAASHDLALFPNVREEMLGLRRSHLQNGFGIVWLTGAVADLDDLERKNAHWVMMSFLGEPLPQNEKGDRYVYVVDEGQRLSAGGRYHQSNEGGELHTDSPQYEQPPEVISLVCVQPAMEGGESKLASAYAVHNSLLRDHPSRLPLLYEAFHFLRKPTTNTTVAPIFTYDGKHLGCRYLGEYVRSGYAMQGETLAVTPKGEALAALDAALSRADAVVELSLAAGDVLVLDNQRILHGRSSFRDDPDHVYPRREMGRLWLRTNLHD